MTALLKNSPYNPITEAEWEHFFNLCDFSHLSLKQQERVYRLFREGAEKHPYYRRLIREQTGPFHVTYSKADRDYMHEAAARGVRFSGQNRITAEFSKSDEAVMATLFHEMRHRQQARDGVWLRESTRRNVYTANKVLEAEALNISAEASPLSNNYFSRLKDKYVGELNETIRDEDIPYAPNLTPEQKAEARALYIETQAFERANADAVTLLMQPNGYQTALYAARNGLSITAEELNRIEYWRRYYREQANDSLDEISVLAHESGDEARRDADAAVFQSYMEARVPGLRGRDYFQPGVTSAEAQVDGLVFKENEVTLTPGVTYFPGTKRLMSKITANENGYTVTVYERSGRKLYDGRYDAQGRRHGRERMYDDGKLISDYTFRADEPTGKGVRYYPDGRRREEKFVDGRCVEKVLYNQDNVKLLEQKGEDLDNHLAEYTETIYQEGRVSYSYTMRGGKKFGKELYEANGERWEKMYSTPGSMSSYSRVVNGVQRARQRHVDDAVVGDGSLMFSQLFDEQGNETAVGYTYNNIRVGRWKVRNPQTGEFEEAFYSGNLGEDGKPERITNPIDVYVKNGYRRNPENKNEYLKPIEGNAGSNDVVRVHELTGMILYERQSGIAGQEVEHRVDGTLKEIRTGGTESRTYHYSENGETVERQFVITPSGGFVINDFFYGANPEFVEKREVSNGAGLVDSRTYYANGKLRSFTNKEGEEWCYTIDGEIESERETGWLCKYKTTRYYTSPDGMGKPGQKGPKRYECIEENDGSVETVYFRRDGSKLKKQTWDKDGNGVEIIYDSDGRVRAKGPIDADGRRQGKWEFNGRGFKCYENGVEVSRQLTATDVSSEQSTIRTLASNSSGCLSGEQIETVGSHVDVANTLG